MNLNVAISNVSKKAKFKSVIHPQFGEQCTNGPLEHTEEHRGILEECGCTFQEYEVDVITYPQLIERCGLKHLDLFVLDVEGNELNVIQSMKGADVLPGIFCVEFGHLNKQTLIDAVVDLGYW